MAGAGCFGQTVSMFIQATDTHRRVLIQKTLFPCSSSSPSHWSARSSDIPPKRVCLAVSYVSNFRSKCLTLFFLVKYYAVWARYVWDIKVLFYKWQSWFDSVLLILNRNDHEILTILWTTNIILLTNYNIFLNWSILFPRCWNMLFSASFNNIYILGKHCFCHKSLSYLFLSLSFKWETVVNNDTKLILFNQNGLKGLNHKLAMSMIQTKKNSRKLLLYMASDAALRSSNTSKEKRPWSEASSRFTITITITILTSTVLGLWWGTDWNTVYWVCDSYASMSLATLWNKGEAWHWLIAWYKSVYFNNGLKTDSLRN